MTPTDEQTHILDLARTSDANLMINAYAGTGKTTTLLMIERGVRTVPKLYLAFNKRIVEEVKHDSKKTKDPEKKVLSTTTVKTLNGVGHGIWARSVNKDLTLPKNKCGDILRALIDEFSRSDQGPLWDSFWPTLSGVALAKSLGYVPDGKFLHAKRLITHSAFHARLEESPDDLTADLIDEVLTRSIKAAYQGSIDFNDQIYMPALFGGTYPQFPFVMVDEYQDLNPVNHAMLDKLTKRRIVGVGDPCQNIYGFRGALAAGMEQAQAKFSMTPLDLSVSFRCPSTIVEAARWRVPQFRWVKEGGHVEHLRQMDGADFPDTATILCRNNAPLLHCALKLLAGGRSVSVAGSDVGPKVVGIMRKLGDSNLSRTDLLAAIDAWLAERLERGSTTAPDIAECMKVFAAFGETLSGAVAYAEHLFKQEGTIRLLTGHKAKGLEFPIVYHLDPWLCKTEENEQDANLAYVILTRSMDEYYEIDSRDIRWNQ